MKVAILSGSVYGTAEEVARHAERQLKAAGLDAWHKANVSLEELLAFAPDAFLTVTSTTGMVSCRTTCCRCTAKSETVCRPGAANRLRCWRWATPAMTPSVVAVN